MNIYANKFGETLKYIRKELSFTQSVVSSLSGINTETLRRIEGGKVLPKFETLEVLSIIYKQDLNNLFLKYRIEDFSYFHEIKNRLERKFDNDESYNLEMESKELNMVLNHINNPFYKNCITQLILLIEGIILYKEKKDYIKALDKLIKAIKVTTTEFKLNNYSSFVYSSIEIRILMNISFIMHKLNKKKEYFKILQFCINVIDPSDKLYPKLCHNISGSFIRKNDFDKALKYSILGIKSAQENRNINGLNILYYGKGIAEYNLDKKEYIKSLNTSIVLSAAFGQEELKNTIINNCKNIFGIEL